MHAFILFGIPTIKDATGAMILGALAITDREPSLANEVLNAAMVSIDRGLEPIGAGVLRPTGICVCSGRNRDWNPRDSHSRANSAGVMERSVRNVVMPNRKRRLRCQEAPILADAWSGPGARAPGVCTSTA